MWLRAKAAGVLPSKAAMSRPKNAAAQNRLINVPVQGQYRKIDMSMEVYTLFDEFTNRFASCAGFIFSVESLEDAIKFIMKDRTIEVLEPNEINLSRLETERLLSRINEGLQNYRLYLEKKMDNWK